MAQYRLEIKKLSANNTSNIVSKASYNARKPLYSDGLHELTNHFGEQEKDKELAYSEIFLPENCSEKFKDRTFLWNAVDTAESRVDAQFAREFIMNLPLETTMEENIKDIKKFVSILTEQGMICDVNIHYKEGNPHVHILCPLRKVKGESFASKRATGYVCVHKDTGERKVFMKVKDIPEGYERIPLIDERTGEQKLRKRKGKGAEKLWLTQSIRLSGGDSKENVFNGRKQWCDIVNETLDKYNTSGTHKSYKDQGKKIIPQIHESAKVRAIEEREEQRCKALNKEYKPVTKIRKGNEKIKRLNQRIIKYFESGKRHNKVARNMSPRVIASSKIYQQNQERLKKAIRRNRAAQARKANIRRQNNSVRQHRASNRNISNIRHAPRQFER